VFDLDLDGAVRRRALMTRTILVTGGTGVLGRAVVRELVARGDDVRSLSRHVPNETLGATHAVGDVRKGTGIAEAAAGVDTLIHLASSPRWRSAGTEIGGTRCVADAARDRGAHLIYVSIVGVDRIPFPYYRAKYAAEQAIEASGARWSILRSTQLHGGLDQFLSLGVWPTTPNQRFQPLDEGELSRQLLEIVDAGPGGRRADVGGPEILSIDAILRGRRSITGRRVLPLPAPRLGFLKALDDGLHLCPENRMPGATWTEWLSRNARKPTQGAHD
jgi:uncharacterized protein YbjT (DUF2867 family)